MTRSRLPRLRPFRFLANRRSVAAGLPLLLLAASAGAQLGVVPQPEPESDPYNPPPAKATPSVSNPPTLVSRPAGALPNVPPGFTANLFAEGLTGPRNMLLAPNGDILVTESRAGRVSALRDADGDGAAEFRERFLTGLRNPFGIAMRDGFLYIAEETRVVRVPYAAGDVKASAAPEPVLTGLPSGGHWTRNLIFSPDGSRAFVAIGSAGNVAIEREPRATIMVYDRDFGNGRVFASGLRNPVGLAWNPVTGALWTCVNERDGLGDDTPPDYATSVADGGFYGWPYAYLGGIPDPNFGSRNPEMVAKTVFPDVPIQAHSAPLGIAFGTSASFPEAYRNGLFIATHGSWNRENRSGYNVLFQPMKEGKPDGRAVVFANGWVLPNESVWGRPVSAAFAADGALLVSDDGGGRIWRIAPESIPPGAPGDVNEDGAVNLSDVTLMLRAVVGLTQLSPVQSFAADVFPAETPDGRLDISDVIHLLRKVVGTS